MAFRSTEKGEENMKCKRCEASKACEEAIKAWFKANQMRNEACKTWSEAYKVWNEAYKTWNEAEHDKKCRRGEHDMQKMRSAQGV